MPGELTFPVLQQHLAGVATVSDPEVAEAVRFAFNTLKLVVEPGGAVALAALLAGNLPEAETVALVLSGGNIDPALMALSDQHFERSKLVVLGLATRDASNAAEADWAYERTLATNLLTDTRLYRIAAEERGMDRLAGVMRDLELVLLQTSMAEDVDAASLAQLQRLIRRRDLITKMNVVHEGGS